MHHKSDYQKFFGWMGSASAVICLALMLSPGAAAQGSDANEIAKELSNPTAALAGMGSNLDFRTFEGDLPEAGTQNSFTYLFQPGLPFPQSNGYNLLVRPAIPVVFQTPVFDPATSTFRNEGVDIGDVGFDVAYGTTYDSGLIFLFGAVGQLPTNTDDDVGVDQVQLGPEVAIGVKKDWGVVGALVTHKWDVSGDDDFDTSVTGGQYFYAFSLANAWQISASPTFSYNHEASSGDKLTLPLGIGVAKTLITMNGTPIKVQVQYWDFIESPDTFGADWQLRFSFTPVIKVPWGKSS